MTLFFVISVAPSFAASFFWTGAGSTAGAPAGGNWDNATTDWSTTVGGATGTAWGAASSTAVFGGVDGSYLINVTTTVNKPQILLFNNSGYTLSNNASQTISFNGTGSGAAPNIQVAAGKTATIGTNITVASTITCLWGNPAGTAGGELDIANGGTLSMLTSTIGQVGVNTVTSVKTGGKLTVAGGAATFILGSVAGDNCIVSVDGGAVTFGSSGTFKVGGNGASAAVLGGTLTVNAGSFTIAPTNPVALTLGFAASNSGTNNLNGGVEGVNGIIKGSGNGYINFNGGTLQAVAGTFAATFLNGLTAANVRNGGAVIDNNGFGITIGQALVHSTIAGDNATDGGLVAANAGSAGSLTLSGANTYNGPTVVKTGASLATTTASSGAGSYAVSNSATLNVQVASSGVQLAMSSLTLGTSGGDVLTNVFTLGANASTTTPAVAASGVLTLNGTVAVNVTGTGLTGPNNYLLMSYASATGAGSFVAGSLPVVSGYTASVTNDATAKKLELIYTLAPPPVQWAVGNGNWDTSTLNWVPLGGGSPTNYSENALAVFDDGASGSSPVTVTLTGNHAPGGITNNSSKNYIFSGGNLTGAPLIKDGSSTLTLDNGSGNTFASVLIKSGALQVGNGDAGGSLGTTGVTNNGTLAFNRTDNPVFANVIFGSGSLIQNGGGTVTLSGTNTYTGGTTVNAGKLVTTTGSVGGGSYTLADGATLEVQVAAAGKSLANNGLTLGTSGNLAAAFTLGANGSTTVPVILDSGALNLNGTVTVNVSGSGLATGTYPLISYGSLSGSGSFVLGSAPLINGNAVSLVNDTAAKQLKLVYTAVTAMTWDSGNTANGATIDAASGTWDLNLANLSWNDGGVNRPWVNSIDGTFAGADGAWSILLAANVSAKTLAFVNSGYAISSASPQSITLTTSGSGAAPNLKINTGKTAMIGNNVALQTTSANNLIVGGSSGAGNPGGTLEIDSGGTVQLAGNATLGLVGTGAALSVKTGGVLGRTIGGTLLLGSAAGDSCALNVDGGSVSLAGSGAVRIGGNSTAANVTGTLNLNAGSFNMDAANTTLPMTLGVNSGNLGTNNLNGGTLAVNQMVQGAGNGYVNFNGGTLKAINGAFSTTFLNGLTAARIQSGGAVIDNNGFAITIGQALLNGGGADGGLTSLGAGSLTLTGANTYTGNTTISNGILVLGGGGSFASSANIKLTGAATMLDVSTVTGGYGLASGQTLSGIGVVTGAVTTASGAVLAPGNNGSGTLSFSNALTLAAASTNYFVVTTMGGASNNIVVAGLLTPNNSVIKITSGTPLHPGTNTLFTYGSISGTFNPAVAFDVAPVHAASIVDNGTGQIGIVVPNTAPVAGASFVMGATVGFPATVRIVGGKYPPADADGDALTVTSAVGATNGAVTTDGTNIIYTATNGTADSFIYTVSDGYGGTASQVVNVTINPIGQGFNLLSAQLVGGNAVLSFAGISGYKYALEWTHDLTLPVTWVPLLTNAAADNGSLFFTNAPPDTNDFYRTRYVP